ncbi:MAG: hypothetical protein AB1454_15110 [Candidatus Auribacterota bacterium]
MNIITNNWCFAAISVGLKIVTESNMLANCAILANYCIFAYNNTEGMDDSQPSVNIGQGTDFTKIKMINYALEQSSQNTQVMMTAPITEAEK